MMATELNKQQTTGLITDKLQLLTPINQTANFTFTDGYGAFQRMLREV